MEQTTPTPKKRGPQPKYAGDRKERRRQASAAYYRKHREQILAKNREEWANDPERRKQILSNQRKWRKKNPERVREQGRKYTVRSNRNSRFGPGAHEWLMERIEKSGNRCESCGGVFTGHGRSNTAPALDHNHDTGEWRGALCGGCNKALGLLKEDPERMEALAAYIRRVNPVWSARVPVREDAA